MTTKRERERIVRRNRRQAKAKAKRIAIWLEAIAIEQNVRPDLHRTAKKDERSVALTQIDWQSAGR